MILGKLSEMDDKTAIEILRNIYSTDYTVPEKRMAIKKVSRMEKYGSITKADFKNVLAWLMGVREEVKHGQG